MTNIIIQSFLIFLGTSLISRSQSNGKTTH
nr:MAG TPA: hypothetical protein [Caudoviricetes sp.]